MKLHEYTQAPNPRRVRIFLAEKGLQVPMVQVDIAAGANRKPEFLKINPMGELAKKGALGRLEWLDGELADRKYIAGDNFSIADITALVGIDFGRLTDIRITDNQKNLKRWHESVSSRPSAKA